MKKINFIVIAACLILSGVSVHGQISTEESPVSFSPDIVLASDARDVRSLPSFDMETVRQEDEEDEQNGIPPRFGYRRKVNYNLNNSGTWTTLPDGDKIWQLEIYCPGALSINLLYDKFRLPEGAKFFVYNSNREHSIGAFTSANNKGNAENVQGFATGLIYGDRVVLEYYLPKNVEEQGVISVAYVVHGYRYIELAESLKAVGYGASGSCNINVNCSEGQNWQLEKNAVAMILVNGNRYCSGSLVNTTAYDCRPLFLTADHCLGGWANDVKYDATGDSLLNHWSFYWHYVSPDCTSSEPSSVKSTVGATVVANNSVSDFALLRLSEHPKDNGVPLLYYLGWDRSGNAGTGGVGIHHPSGDTKKISAYTMTPQSTAYLSNSVNASESHWRVIWNTGTTEGGSSGSPLINSSSRVIGQLHGGYASCSSLSSPDWYGKFSVSWTGNGATDNRRKLQPWLDPIGTNPTTLNGTLAPLISGPDQFCCGSSGTFTAYNAPSGYTWTCSSNLTPGATSGNSKTFQEQNSVGSRSWVAINLGSIEIAKYEFTTGPVFSVVAVPEMKQATVNSSVTVTPSVTGTTNFRWALGSGTGSGAYLHNTYGKNASVSFSSTGGYSLYGYGISSCGESYRATVMYTFSVTSSASYSMSAYPNPVSSVLNVEIEEEEQQETASSASSGASAGRQNVSGSAPAYTVSLYNLTGTLVLQTTTGEAGTVQLNVGSLPDGIYTLHVHDGTDRVPLTQHIVISH